VHDNDAADDFAVYTLTERARAAGIDPRLDCAHHDVRRGRAPRATPVSRRAPLRLWNVPRACRAISVPSVAALVVVVPLEPLAAFLDQGGYLDGTTVGTAYERDRSGRALPTWTGRRVIADDGVFLMKPDEPVSLDGRYFGPIPSAAIVGQAEPI
jgi:type IV secretory pathway protease TraF